MLRLLFKTRTGRYDPTGADQRALAHYRVFGFQDERDLSNRNNFYKFQIYFNSGKLGMRIYVIRIFENTGYAISTVKVYQRLSIMVFGGLFTTTTTTTTAASADFVVTATGPT